MRRSWFRSGSRSSAAEIGHRTGRRCPARQTDGRRLERTSLARLIDPIAGAPRQCMRIRGSSRHSPNARRDRSVHPHCSRYSLSSARRRVSARDRHACLNGPDVATRIGKSIAQRTQVRQMNELARSSLHRRSRSSHAGTVQSRQESEIIPPVDSDRRLETGRGTRVRENQSQDDTDLFAGAAAATDG